MKYRVKVEVEYFIFLLKKSFLNLLLLLKKQLLKIAEIFLWKMPQEIKETESITNHDVKAVEYFLKEKLKNKL